MRKLSAVESSGQVTQSEERAARNEVAFREANEKLGDKRMELGADGRTPFLCECSERLCFQRLELTIERYDVTRSHPQRYLVARGHEVTGALLLEQDDRVAYVEKLAA